MDKIKVLIVDDSALIQALVKSVLESDPQIEVVGIAENPLVARKLIKELNPDVITLDVEMPEMDGITFLDHLMRLRPMPVVMLSTLTTKGADITLEALELGAVDFIAKPGIDVLHANVESFQRVLTRKIKQAVQVDLKKFRLNQTLTKNQSTKALNFNGVARNNHLIAIGASTGGTEAIKAVLCELPATSPAVVVTQHIPKTFSARFASRLDACCKMQVHEAKHGQKIKPGNAYIAPGDLHLTVVSKNGALFCSLQDTAEVNRHKPSVNVLFDSLIPIADNVQAVLLTGMGQDGATGMLKLKQHGARTLIQDKSSSLIWGMPGSAFALDAHTEQSSLAKIASSLLRYAALGRTEMRGELNVNK